MDGRGRCLDNVFIERLWRSLKYEAAYLHELCDGFEAERVIASWMRFYTQERPHSALGGRTSSEGLPPGACGVKAIGEGEGSPVDLWTSPSDRREPFGRWTIKRIHAKLGISRQAKLVRMVLSTAKVHGRESPRTVKHEPDPRNRRRAKPRPEARRPLAPDEVPPILGANHGRQPR